MKQDIRARTCLIVRRNGFYLQGASFANKELIWTRNVYDAWRTRNRDLARKAARKTGGILCLFNPVVSALRNYEEV